MGGEQVLRCNPLIAKLNEERTDQENHERWARSIENYWRERGFPHAMAWAHVDTHSYIGKDGKSHEKQSWSVKTNLVNGMPPSCASSN